MVKLVKESISDEREYFLPEFDVEGFYNYIIKNYPLYKSANGRAQLLRIIHSATLYTDRYFEWFPDLIPNLTSSEVNMFYSDDALSDYGKKSKKEMRKKYFGEKTDKDYANSVIKSVKLGEDINPTQRKWGEKAYNLNRIISAMNNEDAYYGGWLYIWPDGEDLEMACYDFGSKSEYEELENSFKKYYKAYHKDGLYTSYDEVVELAHEWDKKLGLDPIKNFGKERFNA